MMVGALAASVALSLPAWLLAVQAICLMAAAGFILSRPNGRTPPADDRHGG